MDSARDRQEVALASGGDVDVPDDPSTDTVVKADFDTLGVYQGNMSLHRSPF